MIKQLSTIYSDHFEKEFEFGMVMTGCGKANLLPEVTNEFIYGIRTRGPFSDAPPPTFCPKS
jgi:hypothetical protein